MKILPLSYLAPAINVAKKQDKQNSMQTSPMQETTGIPGMYAYRDYNINFGARLFRTPQNFYEQDFNEQNMPRSLHEYIYETGDPAFQRSIPPAQAMKEVFGKIEEAKDLDEVKKMFPNEPLFANLSSKPKRKSREGLLGMINLLKEDPSYADKTLFKNGQNDLGMYIIKKIYIEGKTLKEINKDFNKDVSVYFKSYDITPQDYSAFGIRFPEKPFWKSFIATREDFPYVYIPRAGANGGTGSGSKTTGSHGTRTTDVDHTPKPRKYKLKDYQKKQLTDDIIDAKGDAQAIEKKVIKRFKKDDPEASFIVKYLSPIMTVAADKVHLSEEMRYFAEEEKENGKTVKGATMFERFWKANPFLLKEYSQAITDTIELFEDVYGAGGMIPMNKEFEEITKNSENQKAIDYVTAEYLELLDYTKTIEPKRNARYAKHDEDQALWEAHFMERYGEPNAVIDDIVETVAVAETPELTEEESVAAFKAKLEKEAKATNSKVFTFKLSDGTDFSIISDFKSMLAGYVDRDMMFYPKSYKEGFARFVENKTRNDEKFLLSLFYNVENLEEEFNLRLESGSTTPEDNRRICEDFKKEYLYSTDFVASKMVEFIEDYQAKHVIQTAAVRQVFMEFMMGREVSSSMLDRMIDAKISDLQKEEPLEGAEKFVFLEEATRSVSKIVNQFKGNKVAFQGPKILNEGLKLTMEDYPFDEKLMEERYAIYNQPLSKAEMNAIPKKILDAMSYYDINNSAMNDIRSKYVFKIVSNTLKKNKQCRDKYASMLKFSGYVTPNASDLRAFLRDDVSKEVLAAKAEEAIYALFTADDILSVETLVNADQADLDLYLRPFDLPKYNEIMLLRANKGVI